MTLSGIDVGASTTPVQAVRARNMNEKAAYATLEPFILSTKLVGANIRAVPTSTVSLVVARGELLDGLERSSQP